MESLTKCMRDKLENVCCEFGKEILPDKGIKVTIKFAGVSTPRHCNLKGIYPLEFVIIDSELSETSAYFVVKRRRRRFISNASLQIGSIRSNEGQKPSSIFPHSPVKDIILFLDISSP